jgi:biofilm PGA synthesis N-glycosyltransferase PgaC
MGVDGGMYVVWRELFQPLAADTILDDFVLSVRVMNQGARVIYEPAAVATESGTPTARQEYRRRVRVSAGAVQSIKRGEWPTMRKPLLFWQYLSHKVMRWLGPVLLVLLFVASVMLYREGMVYQVATVGQLVFYAIAGVAAISLAVRSTRLGGVVFYFVMSHVAIADGLIRGLFNRQKVTWAQAQRGSDATQKEAVTAN